MGDYAHPLGTGTKLDLSRYAGLPVTLHLDGGASFEGVLLREDRETVTLLAPPARRGGPLLNLVVSKRHIDCVGLSLSAGCPPK